MRKKNPPKNPSDFITHVKGSAEMRREVERLRNADYDVLLPGTYIRRNGTEKSWSDLIGSQLRSGAMEDGSKQLREVPTLYASAGNEQLAGTENIGTPSLGYIEWGFGNLLPNYVSLLTHMLPYTAAGIEFNTNMVAGLGPQPMYDLTQYVGGNIITKQIRYKDAGAWLRGQITERRRELYNLYKDRNQNTAEDDFNDEIENTMSAITSAKSDTAEMNECFSALADNLKTEIDELEKALKEWERTWPQVEQFCSRNNLPLVWLNLTLDQMMYGVCFPEIQLNQSQLDNRGKQVQTSQWTPSVVGISYRTCHTTRLERMDPFGRINYVYCSNRWLSQAYLDQGEEHSAPIIAIPALDAKTPLLSLQSAILDARQRNVPFQKRPTRFVLPTIYPSTGRPYYPIKDWHSIFGCDIYEYLSTIISDRYTRKRNSNVIGRVIYIHMDYLNQLFIQNKCNTPEDKEKLRDELYEQINTWLSNRDNSGQSLLAFYFRGNDGKDHKSFEIVEIEAASNDAATANEKETAEISSIVFMSMGIDARLMGSSPLSLVGSNGGTDIRERFLLRQILKSPVQNIMLKSLDVLSRFNEWDSHLVWSIKREVMTTLDRSQSGITQQEPV